MREATNTIPEQDEHAWLLGVFVEANNTARREAEYGDDADERDELRDKAFARHLAASGVTAAQAHGIRVILRGCEAARRRENAAAEHERALEAARKRAAARQVERARAPDLFEQSAIDAVGTLTRFHIAYTTDNGGAVTSIEIQGWRQTSRFAGKPQGEFYVLQWTPAERGYGRMPDEGGWHWPANVEHVACTPLAARSLKVRDAFVRQALQSTAFGSISDDDRRQRAALCACADVVDPARAHSALQASAT